MQIDLTKVDEIIQKYSNEESPYIALLQDINDEFRYLPEEALRRVSEKLDVTLTRLYRLATFYSSFNLFPRGKYQIHVCMGTACHVRGASKILDKISSELNIKPGETSEDLNYSLETVNCLGACALGPLIAVNDEYKGKFTLNDVDNLLKELDTQKEEKEEIGIGGKSFEEPQNPS